MSAKFLNSIPLSGTYTEKHFGGNFNNSIWIKFILGDFSEWIGCFGKGEMNFDKVLLNETNNIALVISGGNGFLIDIISKKEISEIEDFPPIESAIYSSKTDSFIFSTFLSIGIFDNQQNLHYKTMNFGVDGIFLTDVIENKVFGQMFSYSDSTNYNIGFEMDITTREVIKNKSELYDCITREKIFIETKNTKLSIAEKLKKIFK